MGDPAGIGPEVIVKALLDPALTGALIPVVIGRAEVFSRITRALNLSFPFTTVHKTEDLPSDPGSIVLLDNHPEPLPFSWGKTNPSCGSHSFQAVREAVQLCQSGTLDAVVTAPISKASWHQAGHSYDGHTGLLAELTQTGAYRMMFASDTFHVVLVTTHLPLKEVSAKLSQESVYQTIVLSQRELIKLGFNHPRIAVCGLNPHAGEGGIFGNEESEKITPAIQKGQAAGIDVSGPHPADTVFLKALSKEVDLVIAQYHDQGLIPIKLLAFDEAVNVTIGLPIIRTSVDHGTAFDIAGKGVADHTNMIHAIRHAARLCVFES